MKVQGRSEEHTSELQSHSDLLSFPTRRLPICAYAAAADIGGPAIDDQTLADDNPNVPVAKIAREATLVGEGRHTIPLDSIFRLCGKMAQVTKVGDESTG